MRIMSYGILLYIVTACWRRKHQLWNSSRNGWLSDPVTQGYGVHLVMLPMMILAMRKPLRFQRTDLLERSGPLLAVLTTGMVTRWGRSYGSCNGNEFFVSKWLVCPWCCCLEVFTALAQRLILLQPF